MAAAVAPAYSAVAGSLGSLGRHCLPGHPLAPGLLPVAGYAPTSPSSSSVRQLRHRVPSHRALRGLAHIASLGNPSLQAYCCSWGSPGHVRDMRHWQQTSGTAAAPIAAAGALLLQTTVVTLNKCKKLS